MSGKRTIDLDRYIPALLTIAANRLAHGASETYRRLHGVGISEWRVMSLLAVQPGITASRICQIIDFDKALTSRVVRKLADQGYVTVTPDEQNASRQLITLTPKGHKVHARVLETAEERERILHAGFTDQELETLVGLLRRVSAQAEIVNAYMADAEPEPDKPARKKPKKIAAKAK